jgi:replicative DNA helicase
MGMTGSGKSVWLNNFAVNAANAGYNVLYVSLEMSDRKIMKRLGSIRLGIPINQYDTISMDEREIKKRIAALRIDDQSGLMAEKKIGKIYVKEYPISTATPDDIDSFLTQLNDIKNVDIDLLIIDYLGIMSAKGAIDSSLYNKGKFIAEGSRAIGQKRNLVVLTATQTAKDA